MKNLWLAIVIVATGLAGKASLGDVITEWNFENYAIGVENNPGPSTGSGVATPLGMTNNFTVPPSSTNCDILNNAGSTTPTQAWRIRGGGTGSGNGWAAAAPQYSQGAQFDVSTVGYKDIVVTYDWFATTQGVKHQQVQYTTDGSNWTNIGPIHVAPSPEAWTVGISIDLSSITGVNNNANFGIRIVSTYAPDGPNAGQYVNLAGNVINSTSGNWRLDSIQVAGTQIVVPEPGSALLLTGALGLLAFARRRHV